MKYKLKKDIIVKSDFEFEYNKQDFITALKNVETRLKEMEAQRSIYVAKMDNVSRNHPYVLDVEEEKRNAIWLYHENFVATKQSDKIIKDLKKGLKEIKNEMKEITKQTGLEF